MNFYKLVMDPIAVPQDKFNHLATTFACSKGSLSFTHLGLPLSLTKPLVVDSWPLVLRCERRLISISIFLSQDGRLELTNVVFITLSTFSMSMFLLVTP